MLYSSLDAMGGGQMRRAGVLVGLVACIAVASACSSSHKPTVPQGIELGQTALKSDIQFRPLHALPTRCANGQQRAGASPAADVVVAASDETGFSCYDLAAAATVVDTVASIQLIPPAVLGSPWAIVLGLEAPERAAISTYTTAHHDSSTQAGHQSTHPEDYLAALVDGYVVSAPVVQAPITGGTIQVTVPGTEATARALFATLTGQ